MAFDVVIPTIGRPSLHVLLRSLVDAVGPLPDRVLIIDDRRNASTALSFEGVDQRVASRITVLKGKAAGPASARNVGWRASQAPFIAFLDDDVVVHSDWLEGAARDIESLRDFAAGSQGHVHVPLPAERRATDWERNVSALQSSAWITADMIYRRPVLEELGGFDERFKRAYREDADFALRVFNAGYAIDKGTRHVVHPVREADPWVSVRLQAGNADDALMTAIHGRDWRVRAGAPPGRWPFHVATVLCFAAWAALTVEFTWRRIAPGPRTPQEIRSMLLTSPLIPFAAVYHRLRGTLRP